MPRSIFKKKSLNVAIKLSNSSDYNMDIELCGEIIPEESSTSFFSTKIEMKLKKSSSFRWKTLEDTGESLKQWDSISTSSISTTQNKKKIGTKLLMKKQRVKNLMVKNLSIKFFRIFIQMQQKNKDVQ